MEYDIYAILYTRPDVRNCQRLSHYRYSPARLASDLVNRSHSSVFIIADHVRISVRLEAVRRLEPYFIFDVEALVLRALFNR
jgi:hypothetical protein